MHLKSPAYIKSKTNLKTKFIHTLEAQFKNQQSKSKLSLTTPSLGPNLEIQMKTYQAHI